MYLLSWQYLGPSDPLPTSASTEVSLLDVSSLPGPPEFRTRRPGDRFSPPQLQCRHRRLKKFFQEQGIPHYMRDTLPLLAFADEILWIGNTALSGNFQAKPTANLLLCIEIRNLHASG